MSKRKLTKNHLPYCSQIKENVTALSKYPHFAKRFFFQKNSQSRMHFGIGHAVSVCLNFKKFRT